MTDSVKDMTTKFEKLDKFEGSDFRRQQKKMQFLLTILKVVYVLSSPAPEYVENETLDQTRKRCKWDNDNYTCRWHILNGMSDALFDVYQNVESAKELWDQLEAKYMVEDISSKKFLVKETLRMEESGKDKGKEIARSSSVNMVEDDKNKKNNKNSKGYKTKFHDKKNDSNKKSKMACWKCGKPGHFKKDCRVKKNNGDDEIAWWIDSGATCHACKDRCWFDTFHLVEDGSVLHMGDESTKPILRRGNGCRAVVRLPEPKKKILSEKGIDCIFIGHAEHSKAYRFYVIKPNDFISVNSVIESLDGGDLLGETPIKIPNLEEVIELGCKTKRTTYKLVKGGDGSGGGTLEGGDIGEFKYPLFNGDVEEVGDLGLEMEALVDAMKRDHTFNPSSFAWCYTYAYILDDGSFIAKSNDGEEGWWYVKLPTQPWRSMKQELCMFLVDLVVIVFIMHRPMIKSCSIEEQMQELLIQRDPAQRKTPLALPWERIPRLDSGVRIRICSGE
nr:retrovirus-related Pol polyprotein from transposon TNT 1-94 [Tanacetum cinerariifolium]